MNTRLHFRERYFPSFTFTAMMRLLFFGAIIVFNLVFIAQPYFLASTSGANYQLSMEASRECIRKNAECPPDSYCMIQCPYNDYYQSMQRIRDSLWERGFPFSFVIYTESAHNDRAPYQYSFQWIFIILDEIILFFLPIFFLLLVKHKKYKPIMSIAMDQTKKSIPPEKMAYVWMGVGIILAIAFIVIGSVFFGLKPGPSNTNATSNSNTEQIDPSLYAPTGN